MLKPGDIVQYRDGQRLEVVKYEERADGICWAWCKGIRGPIMRENLTLVRLVSDTFTVELSYDELFQLAGDVELALDTAKDCGDNKSEKISSSILEKLEKLLSTTR